MTVTGRFVLSTADQKCIRELLFVVKKSVADALPGEQHAKPTIAKTNDGQNRPQPEPTIELISNLIMLG